jgi:alpha-tubulin suppressor-like RCC1 family protein
VLGDYHGVVHTGGNYNEVSSWKLWWLCVSGKCNVSEWTDVIAVSAKSLHTIGLKADGTVVSTGYNYYGQCDVSSWKNIKTPWGAALFWRIQASCKKHNKKALSIFSR